LRRHIPDALQVLVLALQAPEQHTPPVHTPERQSPATLHVPPAATAANNSALDKLPLRPRPPAINTLPVFSNVAV
jgi:hypothetical protein